MMLFLYIVLGIAAYLLIGFVALGVTVWYYAYIKGDSYYSHEEYLMVLVLGWPIIIPVIILFSAIEAVGELVHSIWNELRKRSMNYDIDDITVDDEEESYE